ncbi:MAG: 50S ribosomal protein L2 [Candidatus Harrisonbacteria bacterium CG10_big_fil_rev_8_21_14_0_10_45_28]|uniref:Large ribosomal subunit protein uL2 n=1 Tax=Candidatus Harrisonbacteria bacterium CG10_big_fil_rev_8_21_14_0_10_45_28 TaxID=1974586 RepID=A0A2H0UR20_9BACT|nr:MAG: 50S ribosomal protein L2 [Candidatus Harrisonbacteria bacterium CG10_big_fil_rev_8_21_14_0_10_45_28]
MKKYNPTSPSQRQRVSVNYREVLSGVKKPKKSLLKKVKASSGRNHHGRITVRHQGGGHKKRFRDVDLMQLKRKIPATVKTIEYDPYRSGFIALVCFADGEYRYMLAAEGMKVGDKVITDDKTVIKPGNRMKLVNIPIGQVVHSVELRVNGGAKLARSAGSGLEVLGSSDGFTDLKMPSKELRKVPSDCFASIGKVSNAEYNLINLGKAGRSRWLGIRPTVRGSAMNPVDHKYGGGEGAQPRGTKRPKDIWGNITGGRKTRDKKKWSKKFIVKRRPTVRGGKK